MLALFLGADGTESSQFDAMSAEQLGGIPESFATFSVRRHVWSPWPSSATMPESCLVQEGSFGVDYGLAISTGKVASAIKTAAQSEYPSGSDLGPKGTLPRAWRLVFLLQYSEHAMSYHSRRNASHVAQTARRCG